MTMKTSNLFQNHFFQRANAFLAPTAKCFQPLKLGRWCKKQHDLGNGVPGKALVSSRTSQCTAWPPVSWRD